MPFRYEAWPLPGSATFEKKFDIPEALPGSSGVRELSDWSDGTLFLPASYSKLSSLVSETVGSLIRVYLGSTLIDEFDAARVELVAGRPNTVVVSGPQRNGLVEGIATLPRNYPEHKEGALHWKWGAENVIPDIPLGSLGHIREVWEVHHNHTSGSWTADVDSDSNSIAFNATAAQVEGTSETLSPPGSGFQGLTTVNDVTVSGDGSSGDPYVITFYDPPDPTTVSLTVGTLSGGSTFSATKTTEGQLDPKPVTISKPVDAGAGDPDAHGTYDNPALQVNTQSANIDTGADWSARVNALTRYAGCQLLVDVIPGSTYSNLNVRVKPNTAGDFTLVIRDIYENLIARKSDVALTAGSFQDLTINTLTIPPGVEQVIFRVAATDATPANIDTFWVNMQGATMLLGEPEATFTEIVTELLDAAHARDTATFLELDASASADSLSTALADINFTVHVGDKRNLSHVLAEGQRIGYQWRVVPAADALIITPAAGTTHVLQIFYVDADEIEDLTASAGGPSVTVGSHVKDAQLVTRRAPFTTLIGLGAGAVYAEGTNATAEAGVGRIEQVRDVDHLASSTSVQSFLDASFAEEARNRKALSATVLESAGKVPLVDYGEGSKIWWQFPGIHSKEARPVKRIGYVHGAEATFQLQGSRVLSGEAAMAAALDRFLREPGRRRDDKPKPSPTSLAGGAIQRGAHIHLARSATQSIAASGEAISWDFESFKIAPLNFPELSLPVTEVPIQTSGYYDIEIAAEWSTWQQGGSVWIVRKRGLANVTVAPPDDDPGIWTATDGQRGTWVAKGIPLALGDSVEVHIDHNDGSAKTLTRATLSIELIDRQFLSPDPTFFYYDVILADNPIAYYLFDSDTDPMPDESPSGYDLSRDIGTIAAVSGIMKDGSSRGALDFQTGSWHDNGNEVELAFTGTQAFSIEYWVELDAGSKAQTILYRRDPSGPDGWSVGINSSDQPFFNRANGTTTNAQTSGTAITVGAIAYVAHTYDGTNMRTYINGALTGGPTASSISMTDAGVGFFVGEGFASSDKLDGTLDELAIYDRALTLVEIQHHYAVGTQAA